MNFYAQPYDIDATGFYFETADEYATKSASLKNSYGQPVEEFEIQFIDGTAFECALARDINQANISAFIEFIDGADDDTLLRACIAVGDGICSLSEVIAGTADLEDIDIYEDMTMRDLAGHFVDEGLFGEIPEALQNYIDLDAIARDLSMDYATTTIDGTAYIYRAA
jgi:hypothetical protein